MRLGPAAAKQGGGRSYIRMARDPSGTGKPRTSTETAAAKEGWGSSKIRMTRDRALEKKLRVRRLSSFGKESEPARALAPSTQEGGADSTRWRRGGTCRETRSPRPPGALSAPGGHVGGVRDDLREVREVRVVKVPEASRRRRRGGVAANRGARRRRGGVARDPRGSRYGGILRSYA